MQVGKEGGRQRERDRQRERKRGNGDGFLILTQDRFFWSTAALPYWVILAVMDII